MKIQKQLNRHDPANGIYGDCFRTAIAIVLDMNAADVPHFMDAQAYNASADGVFKAVEAWLNARGLTQINVLFPGETRVRDILGTVAASNPNSRGIVFMLSGQSGNGVNHVVVCCDGEIVCDPAQDDSGIIGPCDDGFYWVTFFGSMRAVHRP